MRARDEVLPPGVRPRVAVAQAERVHVDRVDHPARLGDDHAHQRVVHEEPEEHVRRRHGGSPLPSVGRQQRRVAPDTADEGVDALLPLALIEELVDLRLGWGGLGCHGARGSVTTWKRCLHAQPRTWEVEQSPGSGLVPAKQTGRETQKATRTAITLTALTRWAAIPRRTSDGSPARMTSRRARRLT